MASSARPDVPVEVTFTDVRVNAGLLEAIVIPPRPRPATLGLSVDVHTGRAAPIFDTFPTPRPPNRAQRRARAR